jgi:hypothetical protein
MTPSPLYISASAVGKKRRCERIIGFEYVEGIRPEPGPKRQFGLDVHDALAKWLKHGTPPDDSPAGKVAKQSIRADLLPAPSSALRVEEKFEVPAPDAGENVFFVGYVDLEVPGTDPLVVTDHKSTGSLRYALSPEKLAEDPQGVLYAAAAMERTGADNVLARWNYLVATNPKTGPRKPGGVRKVEHVFDRVDPAFGRELAGVVADARRIVEIRRAGLKGLELEPSPGSCGDYGGCDHRDRCNLSPILEANALVAAAGVEPLTDCADPVKGSAHQTRKRGNQMSESFLKKLERLKAEASADPSPVNPPVEMNPNNLPPPVTEVPAEPAGEACPGCGKTYKRLATHLKACPQLTKAEPVPQTTAQTTAQPTAQVRTEPQTTAQAPADGFVAIFDALFYKNETLANQVQRLEDVVKPFADQVALENQKRHWGEVEYAKGPPQLAAKLEAWLASQNGAFRGVLLCDSHMAETRACREVVIRRASVVICGNR